jgi:plasmid maintenance system killer protein
LLFAKALDLGPVARYLIGNFTSTAGVTREDNVEIVVKDKKLKEALESEEPARRQYGKDMAKKLHMRRDALMAAESLADFWPPNSLPERVHELKGNLKGLFSIDLKHPYRLLFKAVDAIEHDDDRTRWRSIKKIEAVTIEDTHG